MKKTTQVEEEEERSAPRAQCLLNFLLGHPLFISTFGTTTFSVGGIIALIYDLNNNCKPDLKLWLSISIGRSLVRLLLRYILEMQERGWIRPNFGYVYKIVEMLDVFGLVWFSVGNLLVFNGPQCA